MTGKILGRGTWIDKVANSLVERERRLGRSLDIITTESGLGASGIPHVGSMADAVRSYAVTLALRDAGYVSKTIAFCDDMDGLRRVPDGLPRWLEAHLLKPVSLIPDPFGCHDSYGLHMSGLLREALEECMVEYEYRSGHETYASGALTPFIERILLSWRIIGEKIEELTGQTKFKESLPYFAICGNCGKIYTTRSLGYDDKNKKVHYVCEEAKIRGKTFDGCGFEGYVDIRGANGKLSWKAGEFAARWALLDVRFEAYGKDIADSVKVNDWISQKILGFEPPMHLKYELFLDVSGGKISKSAGNVFTPQVWLRYGSPKSIILYCLKRFRGTRRLSLDTVRKTMLEMDYLKDVYFSRVKVENPKKLTSMKSLLEYAHRLNPVKDVVIPYGLALNLALAAPPGGEEEFLVTRLKAYGYTEEEIKGEITGKIRFAVNWAKDIEEKAFERKLKLKVDEREALIDLREEVSRAIDPSHVQNTVFQVARRHGLKPRDFFPVLYTILIGRREGPRLGPLIMDMGRENVVKILSKYIGRDTKQRLEG